LAVLNPGASETVSAGTDGAGSGRPEHEAVIEWGSSIPAASKKGPPNRKVRRPVLHARINGSPRSVMTEPYLEEPPLDPLLDPPLDPLLDPPLESLLEPPLEAPPVVPVAAGCEPVAE